MKKVITLLLFLGLVLTLCYTPHTEVNAKTVKKTGYYYTYAQRKAASYSYNKMSLKRVKIKRRKIITYGSFDYSKRKYGYGGKRLKNKKRSFKIAKNCKYWTAWGVPGGDKRITKKTFNKDLKRFSKYVGSGQCFIIHMRKGKVVDMMLGQG